MSVRKLQLDIEELRKASQKALERGDFEDSIFFIKKAIDMENEDADSDFLAKIYRNSGLFNESNKILFKLYNKTGDQKYLNQVVDNLVDNDNVTEALRYEEQGVQINSIDMNDIEKMFNNLFNEPKKFKVAYPITEEYFEQVLDKARELSTAGEFLQSNKLLEFRDYSKLDNYIDAIRIKAVNYMNLGDVNGLIEFSKSLLNTKYEVYARTYLMFCYLQIEDNANAREELNKVIKLQPEENIVLSMPIMLVDTNFLEESLYFANQIIENYSYGVKDICLKAILEYLLNERLKAYKTLSKANKIFGNSPYIYIVKTVFDLDVEAKKVSEFIDIIDNKIVTTINYLSEIIVKGSKQKAIDLIISDEFTNNVFRYVLMSNNVKHINAFIKILDVAFTEEIGDILRELLLDNFVLDEVKTSIIKILIEFSEDKRISFVLANLYLDYDFTYPLNHFEENVLVGYYDALLFNFQASITPINDGKIIADKLKAIDKLCVDKKVALNDCDSRIISVLLCYNKGMFNEESNLNKLLAIFGVKREEFDRWYSFLQNLIEV